MSELEINQLNCNKSESSIGNVGVLKITPDKLTLVRNSTYPDIDINNQIKGFLESFVNKYNESNKKYINNYKS